MALSTVVGLKCFVCCKSSLMSIGDSLASGESGTSIGSLIMKFSLRLIQRKSTGGDLDDFQVVQPLYKNLFPLHFLPIIRTQPCRKHAFSMFNMSSQNQNSKTWQKHQCAEIQQQRQMFLPCRHFLLSWQQMQKLIKVPCSRPGLGIKSRASRQNKSIYLKPRPQAEAFIPKFYSSRYIRTLNKILKKLTLCQLLPLICQKTDF